MRYRSFRRLSTAQRLEPVITAEINFSIPAADHAAQVAAGYGFAAADVAVDETDTPPDLTGALAAPLTPLTPGDQEHLDAQGLRLPTFAQIDTFVDNLFPAFSDPQRAFLKRLAKIERVLIEIVRL